MGRISKWDLTVYDPIIASKIDILPQSYTSNLVIFL